MEYTMYHNDSSDQSATIYVFRLSDGVLLNETTDNNYIPTGDWKREGF